MSPLIINSHLTKCWCLVSPFCCCVSGFISGNTQGFHRRLSLMQKWKCQTLSGQLESFSLCAASQSRWVTWFCADHCTIVFPAKFDMRHNQGSLPNLWQSTFDMSGWKMCKTYCTSMTNIRFLRLHLQKETAPSWVWSAVLPAASSWQHVCWTSFQIICLTSAASWKFGRSRCVFNCLSEWQSK